MGLRVLVVTVVHTPLDARIHHRQITSLLDAGHRVTYAAPWSAYGTRPPTRPGMRPVDVPRAQGRRRLDAWWAARRLVAAQGPHHDVVVLHDPELLLATAGLRAPLVLDVHEDAAAALVDRPWLPPWTRPLARWLVRATERLAERRVPLLLAEEGYRERFSRPHPVIRNVPRIGDPPPEPGAARVIYIGRLSRRRGAHELVGLGRRLAGDATVELIGPADADVAGALRRAHADGVVSWRGFVPNARALEALRGATAGLSLLHDEPNYRVSLPTKVVEYMAAGIPVVTTPLPRARDLVERHGCGRVVPFGDPEATEAAVRGLLADASARRALGAAGRRAAERCYDWADEQHRFLAALTAAAEGRRRTSPGSRR